MQFVIPNKCGRMKRLRRRRSVEGGTKRNINDSESGLAIEQKMGCFYDIGPEYYDDTHLGNSLLYLVPLERHIKLLFGIIRVGG